MDIYGAIKGIHIICVSLSFLGFCLRSYFLLCNPKKLTAKWLKYPPHIVESLLLLSALAMLPLIEQYPFMDDWLTAKIIAMLLYIVVAGYTLHVTYTFKTKLFFVTISLSIFLYIIGIALSHHQYSWFALIFSA